MNERNYRKYAQEFKLEALEFLKRGDKSAGQIERELGITPGQLVSEQMQSKRMLMKRRL
jgi:transposase-like protein